MDQLDVVLAIVVAAALGVAAAVVTPNQVHGANAVARETLLEVAVKSRRAPDFRALSHNDHLATDACCVVREWQQQHPASHAAAEQARRSVAAIAADCIRTTPCLSK